MAEIAWGWPEIAVVLMWRLAPKGVVITRRDLGRLPVDRVLLEDRRETEIRLTWISIEEAQARTKPLTVAHEKASVSELQGRWQKIAVVLLWKLAKNGVTLTQADREAVPADQRLLAHGHADDIEYRFVPHAEAVRIERFERDNEGRIITERTRL
jgi:hypothetical protein